MRECVADAYVTRISSMPAVLAALLFGDQRSHDYDKRAVRDWGFLLIPADHAQTTYTPNAISVYTKHNYYFVISLLK